MTTSGDKVFSSKTTTKKELVRWYWEPRYPDNLEESFIYNTLCAGSSTSAFITSSGRLTAKGTQFICAYCSRTWKLGQCYCVCGGGILNRKGELVNSHT